MKTVLGLFVGSVMAALVTFQDEPLKQERILVVDEGLSFFVIEYEPGDAWVQGKPVFEQNLQAHGEYMAELQDEGVLQIGGPYLDDAGGLAVIASPDLATAKAVAAGDPAVLNEVFKAEVHPYYPVFNGRSRDF